MNARTKTPAMILQELTVKKGIAPPAYELILAGNEGHETLFQYRVCIEGECAVGSGRSKQVAKHEAAASVLKKLAEKGIYNPEVEPASDFNAQLHRNEPIGENQPFNCIGSLQDICEMNKLPHPIYECLSDVGPPHAKQFTYQCTISSMKTKKTANTKKQAKQLAAREMLDRIKDVCSTNLIQEANTNFERIAANEELVIKKFNDLSVHSILPNKSAMIEDFPNGIKNRMNERLLTLDELKDDFTKGDEESLKNLLDKMDLDYKISILSSQRPVLVVLSLSLDTPFSVFGQGCDVESAREGAVQQAFKFLKCFMK